MVMAPRYRWKALPDGEFVPWMFSWQATHERPKRRTLVATEFASYTPDQLSGGQQRRIALARALAPQPDLVLLDEPFAALDSELRRRLRDDVRRALATVGATSLLVTHDQEEALTLSDRIAVFSNGNIVQLGTSKEIYENPNSQFVAEFVGISNLIHRDGKVYSVRPEKIKLGAGFSRVHSAKVSGVSFLGPLTRVEARLNSSDLLTLMLLNDGVSQMPKVGEEIEISWDSTAEFQVS